MTQSSLRVLIADDERMARRRLGRLLRAIGGVEVVAECERGDEALAQIEERSAGLDLALLDIRMPGLSGLEVSEFAGPGVLVVFTTAHPDHALQAFDRGAIDYVLKPIERARLALALERVRQRLKGERAEVSPANTALDRLAVTVRGEVRLLAPEEISHAHFDGHLVTLFVGEEAILVDVSLQELERRLGSGFERVHRRALLNLAHVDRLKPLSTGGYLAVVKRGREVPVSRQAARTLRRRLGIA